MVSSSGLPPTGSKGLGVFSVKGRTRAELEPGQSEGPDQEFQGLVIEWCRQELDALFSAAADQYAMRRLIKFEGAEHVQLRFGRPRLALLVIGFRGRTASQASGTEGLEFDDISARRSGGID